MRRTYNSPITDELVFASMYVLSSPSQDVTGHPDTSGGEPNPMHVGQRKIYL